MRKLGIGTRAGPPAGLSLQKGERMLARASGVDSVVVGTRDAIYLSTGAGESARIAWEQVAAADWDSERQRLRIIAVAEWGEPAPTHVVALGEAGLLLQLVRERVTASMVVQRHVPVDEGRQVRILARRAPSGRGDLSWFVEYDAGLAPDDPAVATVVDAALAAAKSDIGAPI